MVDNRLNMPNQPISPLRKGPAQPKGSEGTAKQGRTGAVNGVGQSFGQVLAGELSQDSVKFSAHAVDRINKRSIELPKDHMSRLGKAVEMAEAKGSREALVLMDNLALVVSIKNRTVITAVDGPNMKESIFTNIDSAVIT